MNLENSGLESSFSELLCSTSSIIGVLFCILGGVRFVCMCVLLFDTNSYYVDLTSLDLIMSARLALSFVAILLLLSPGAACDYRHAPSHLASSQCFYALVKLRATSMSGIHVE